MVNLEHVIAGFHKKWSKNTAKKAPFTGLRPATLLKKRLWHRCFSVNFAKFLRTPFSQKTSGLLLLCLTGLWIRLRLYYQRTVPCKYKFFRRAYRGKFPTIIVWKWQLNPGFFIQRSNINLGYNFFLHWRSRSLL